MFGRTDSRGRLLALLAVLVLLSGGMTARLAYWQMERQPQLTALAAQDARYSQQSIPAKRGTIYDRTGTIVLAETVNRYRVVANLHDLSPQERQRDADALVDYLNLDPSSEAAFRKAMTSTDYYVPLAANVDAETAKEITDAQANGALAAITLEPTPVRVYPQAGGAPHTSLAAQMLGFVNYSGMGQYGLEQQYDDVLSGKPSSSRSTRMSRARPANTSSTPEHPARTSGRRSTPASSSRWSRKSSRRGCPTRPRPCPRS